MLAVAAPVDTAPVLRRLGRADYAPTLFAMRQFTAGAPLGIFGTFAIHFGGT